MLKEVEVVEEGFEKVVEVLKENIATINDAKAKEIAEATEKIEAKYKKILDKHYEELSHIVHTEMIELPCEVAETDDIPAGAEIVDVVDISEVPTQSASNAVSETDFMGV